MVLLQESSATCTWKGWTSSLVGFTPLFSHQLPSRVQLPTRWVEKPETSVGNSHFGADRNPDSRIRTSDKRIQTQLRIRLLSSVTLKRKWKEKMFFHTFSYKFSTGTLSSVLKIKLFAKLLCSNFILQAFFQSAQHLYEKREGSGSSPLTNGSRSWRPKNIRIQIHNPARNSPTY
jgi:hypothetical protein